MERATELEFLKWFFAYIKENLGTKQDKLIDTFIQCVGKNLPDGYNYYSTGKVADKNLKNLWD